MKLAAKFTLALFIAFSFLSCSDNEGGSAKIQVSLVDAPADYDSVFVDIQDVQVNASGDPGGWISLESATMGVYDLLQLTNGEEAFLGEVELPEGKLAQVRLILGTENSLVMDGETYALTTPSGQESGLKLNVHADILAGITYKLVIDFDAAKSVVSAGSSGKYNLKPVIRAVFEATTGAIEGVISPVDSAAVIYAIQGTDTATSTYPDEDGMFLLRALPEGTYDVVAEPADSTLNTAIESGVGVVIGEVTSVDTLYMD
ncbi:DUF4382 domain-containing protein [Marinoscillum sp. MHG1-6]|uniref:DUF4382 domain-containing protein n=1 Tax=Marinoscillum sp. MHG1-6 TaxID=2959627 RepID=UPI002158324D|nr:DUF4382 domain-containing protein [Marinoscillum sp. MHG1-6]